MLGNVYSQGITWHNIYRDSTTVHRDAFGCWPPIPLNLGDCGDDWTSTEGSSGGGRYRTKTILIPALLRWAPCSSLMLHSLLYCSCSSVIPNLLSFYLAAATERYCTVCGSTLLHRHKSLPDDYAKFSVFCAIALLLSGVHFRSTARSSRVDLRKRSVDGHNGARLGAPIRHLYRQDLKTVRHGVS
jgi:hypothetical protein